MTLSKGRVRTALGTYRNIDERTQFDALRDVAYNFPFTCLRLLRQRQQTTGTCCTGGRLVPASSTTTWFLDRFRGARFRGSGPLTGIVTVLQAVDGRGVIITCAAEDNQVFDDDASTRMSQDAGEFGPFGDINTDETDARGRRRPAHYDRFILKASRWAPASR